jgi:hypothetical protein
LMRRSKLSRRPASCASPAASSIPGVHGDPHSAHCSIRIGDSGHRKPRLSRECGLDEQPLMSSIW